MTITIIIFRKGGDCVTKKDNNSWKIRISHLFLGHFVHILSARGKGDVPKILFRDILFERAVH